MAGFSEIIGHEKIIEHLQGAITTGKVSHAYILNGPKSSGKMMIAEAFARALQCENGDPAGCGECKSCRQAADRNQPDIIYVGHEDNKALKIDDIRSQLNNDIDIKPYSSKYKIYIVDDAQTLNIQGQNALLKTIEEPPAYGIIILLTTNADSFLPTILSRCILLNLKPVKDEVIKRHLMSKHQMPDYQANICAAYAQGVVGKAITLASSASFNELKSDTLSLVKRIEDIKTYELGESVKIVAGHKDMIGDFLDLLTIWYRDVLLTKATDDGDAVIFKDELYDIRKHAAKHSYVQLENIIQAIEQAKVRLNANVNFDLTMEMLLMTIKEN